MAGENKQLILDLIEDIPDFPKPGVTFKDITPLLASPDGLRAAITELVALAPERIDVVVGMEARGFILACQSYPATDRVTVNFDDTGTG